MRLICGFLGATCCMSAKVRSKSFAIDRATCLALRDLLALKGHGAKARG